MNILEKETWPFFYVHSKPDSSGLRDPLWYCLLLPHFTVQRGGDKIAITPSISLYIGVPKVELWLSDIYGISFGYSIYQLVHFVPYSVIYYILFFCGKLGAVCCSRNKVEGTKCKFYLLGLCRQYTMHLAKFTLYYMQKGA